ncbi:alpha-amylase [Balneatrix alpica]|uniref:alpha-amylase n=1 Tax=Balneatrix alpica TaxID=75684 RepID=UPI0027389737|nr:alpha-amylase [Balneatrix alpica]
MPTPFPRLTLCSLLLCLPGISFALDPACQPWQGEQLRIEVADTFAEGSWVRDFYSGQRLQVNQGAVSLVPSASGIVLLEQDSPPAPWFDWRNASVYFVMTDRFYNGNPDNDQSYGRRGDGQQEIGTFHGGDLAGLTAKLDYLQSLGIQALWISSPLEQIHGWVGGGDKGDFPHYAYHGYYPLDFTRLDANMGKPDELRALVEGAHQRGIRVLFDVVMNHSGYATLADMQSFNIGGLRKGMEKYLPPRWSDWQPEPWDNWHGYHALIDYDHPNWQRWWGKDWVRAGIADYDTPPSIGVDELQGSLSFLPDFKTESPQPVALPAFLQHKEDSAAKPLADARVRDYLIHWLSQWVRDYGLDGFRVDTARHVELSSWQALKQQASQAKEEAKGGLAGPFWMVGEVFGAGPEQNAYHQHGFDALINFEFQAKALAASHCLAELDSLYQDYAQRFASGHNALSYASSHDTQLFTQASQGDLKLQQGLANALLLSPGAVQIYYGDESARLFGATGSDPYQGTRSDMNWDDLQQPAYQALLQHWQRLGQFRQRHPAIGAGQHRRLSQVPYVFIRELTEDGQQDKVIIAWLKR